MKSSGLYGKYRGTVVSNIDPEGIGRLQVALADAGGMIPLSSYATPCLPMSGVQQGIFAVPTPGAGVWIEFEEGDIDRPIWVGGFWGSRADVPKTSLFTQPPLGQITLATLTGAGIHISDNPAIGIVITTGTATLMINAQGILISNGAGSTIAMVGKIIDFNQAALTVGP